jgi:hypothetical protein
MSFTKRTKRTTHDNIDHSSTMGSLRFIARSRQRSPARKTRNPSIHPSVLVNIFNLCRTRQPNLELPSYFFHLDHGLLVRCLLVGRNIEEAIIIASSVFRSRRWHPASSLCRFATHTVETEEVLIVVVRACY